MARERDFEYEDEPRPRENIPNYLVQAILCTLCCCLPFGIVAIVYAAQVNGKLAEGNLADARSSSANAKMWCWISFGVGLPVQVIALIVQVYLAMQGQAGPAPAFR